MTERKDLDALLATKAAAHNVRGKTAKHPPKWEPGVVYDDVKGKGTATAILEPGQKVEDIEWGEILSDLGLGGVAKFLRVTQVRAWNSGDKVCHYVRSEVVRDDGQSPLDVEEMLKLVHDRKPKRPRKKKKMAKASLVVALSDWQIGKKDGDGVKGTIDRVWDTIEGVKRRINELRQAGIKVDQLTVVCLGDLVEGCDGHYPMQTFRVQLDRREQCRVTRALLLECLMAWTPLVRDITVACVPGNHGENRKDGRAFTTFGDNDDVAVVEQLAESCALSDKLKHIEFVIPKNELTVTLDVKGVGLALAHGHQLSSSRREKIIEWWKDMAHRGHSVGACQVLVTGHFHHLLVTESGHKTHFQTPALDGGSEWFGHKGGPVGYPGTLTFVMGTACGPRGWDHMKVLL